MDDPQQRIIIGIGEALFDCFEDRTVMGGAPLNAALIAHALGPQFGLGAAMISRVGRDELGERLLGTLRERDFNTAWIQRDDQAPTGRVLVELIDGEPRYEIIEDVAWDRLAWTEALARLAPAVAGITFGTLAQRSKTSGETVQRFLQTATQAVRMFDVNLRQSFYSADILRRSCELADAVKLNGEELRVVAELLGLPADDAEEPELVERFRREFQLRAVVLTHGAKGTELVTADGRATAPVPRFAPQEGADPVGAGDACGAACLLGFVLDWPPERIVTVANRVGAYVASRQGATPTIDPQTVLNIPA